MRVLLLGFIILSFSACKKDPANVNPIIPVVIDSFNVTVNNGYGSGRYPVGDTVHIFSNNFSYNQLFDKWTGNVEVLSVENEWHTWFKMPRNNVELTGEIKSIPLFTLQYEQIRGRDRLKPVYSHFPANHKGIVYLLHGTGGTAQNLILSFEFIQLIKTLCNDSFAVMVTEAEEATTGIDTDADGKLRWATYPVDTLNNVDYVNLRILTDTFYNRGISNRSKPRYSIGMSNGGAFSAALSYAYNFRAGVSYCAPGGNLIAQASTVPFQFCMARFDNNVNVGVQGNADALANSTTLSGRGICSNFLMKERSPLYPERFARRGDVSVTKSRAVFAELKSNGFLDSKNYFIGFSSELFSYYQANPTLFPEINSLASGPLGFVLEQIDLSISDHKFYSDFNSSTLQFLNDPCL